MLPKLCVRCNKWFSCKSSLNRHDRKVHGTHVQPPVNKIDNPEQSDGSYGDDEVQSTSDDPEQNADNNQVDVASQTYFDDDRSMIGSDVSDSDNNSGDSEFSESSDGDEPYILYNFSRQETCKQMKKNGTALN